MNAPLPCLLAATLLFACKGKQETATNTGAPASPPSATHGSSSGQAGATLGGGAQGDSLFLRLERTFCFGSCPAYRLHVYRSGFATFEGRGDIEPMGMHRARIGADTLALLLAEAERSAFFSLDDEYDEEVTDLPSTYIQVVAGGRDKTVHGRYGIPPRFLAFRARIEELLLTVDWKPVQPKD